MDGMRCLGSSVCVSFGRSGSCTSTSAVAPAGPTSVEETVLKIECHRIYLLWIHNFFLTIKSSPPPAP